MLTPKIPDSLVYGCDYNPEQWPEAILEEDVALMQECGVNLVNLGIFSWTAIQPRPNVFEFAWLDRIMDRLHNTGIFVNLATATASPPAWLGARYPEIFPVTREGVVLRHGSRQAYTPNSSAYRDHVAVLVEAIASRYKDHPALAMWHVNNEYMCHVASSHGEVDDVAFRTWLGDRYGSTDALNAAWHTHCRSQSYGSWDEVHTPKATPASPNPAAELDFRRFMSAANQACYELERAILKKYTPDIPVTTNFIGGFQPVDCHAWADGIDCAALDAYPNPDPALDSENSPFDLDMMRSLKQGQPFMLVEQAVQAINGRQQNHGSRPGLMRLRSLQAVARGADAVQFFQWRQSLDGSERFHSAMVPAVHPRPSDTYRSVVDLGKNLQKLAPLADSRIEAECAIIFDWETWWALSQESLPRDFDYRALVDEYHHAFRALNIPVEFIPPSADLSKYKAIFAPTLFLLSKAEAAAIEAFTRAGGIFVSSFFTGVSDRSNRLVPGGFPAYLRDVLGLWIETWEPEESVDQTTIRMLDGRTIKAGYFTEKVHAEGADVLGYFSAGAFEGLPALTVNRCGKGFAYYVATRPKASFYRYALADLADRANLRRPPVETSGNVEVTVRQSAAGKRFLCLLNHGTESAPVQLKGVSGTDLLSGKACTGTVTLAPRDAVFIACS